MEKFLGAPTSSVDRPNINLTASPHSEVAHPVNECFQFSILHTSKFSQGGNAAATFTTRGSRCSYANYGQLPS